jgi:hypothetical protein
MGSELRQYQFLSAVDFERYEKTFLLALELREFLHNQGQKRPKLPWLPAAKSSLCQEKTLRALRQFAAVTF